MADTRYSILNSSTEEVASAGGRDIQAARFSGIIFAELTEDQVKQLEQMGCVVAHVAKVKTDVIAPPIPIAAIPTYSPSELVEIAGYEMLRDIVKPPLYGEGMNAAIIGTGIRGTHQQLAGRVVYNKNFTSGVMRDGFDHDTGVASIITTIVPKCNLLNMKVMDDKGEGSEEAAVMAIEECIELHDAGSGFAPSVINLSLGGRDEGNPNSPMRIACRTAIKIGIWVFAAAGNTGPSNYTIMSPGCERYIFTVGSAKYLPDQKTFRVSDFSSRGPTQEGLIKPDAVLFGEDIIMASSASDTATTYKSGTSFATPFGSAMGIMYLEGVIRKAASLVELGELPPAELYFVPTSEMIDQYLPRISIKPSGVPTPKDTDYGFGMPYGPYIVQVLRPRPAFEPSAVLATILPVMVVLPMMGMVMKATRAEGKSKK